MATTVNMHEAKTQFSRLVQRALQGEEVVVARAGKAMVRLVPVNQRTEGSWIGCLEGQGYAVPEDFNEMGRTEIEEMFFCKGLKTQGRPQGRKRAAA